VDRVVDATPVLAAVAQVERRDPDVLQERRTVRARAKRPDPEIGSAVRFIPRFGGACRRNGAELVPLPDGELRFGVLNVPRHVVDELLEGGLRGIAWYSGLRLQWHLPRRCTFAGTGPTWYVSPRPPRHSSCAVRPASAASRGWGSPYEIGSTGILVIVCASAVARRFAC